MPTSPEFSYLFVSALLFVIGAIGVVTRRSAITILMCIELMLNAANLAMIALGRSLPPDRVDGQIMAFFVLAIAAAEAAVGLAIVISLYRLKGTADIDAARLLRW